MAKRKTTKKKSTHRRRSRKVSGIGAVAQSMTSPILMIGGAVLGRFAVNKLLASQNDTIKGAAQVAVGFVATNFTKNDMVHSIGKGMIVGGGLSLVKSFAPSIIGATEDDIIVISGQDQVGGEINEINGVDQIGTDINEINGIDSDEMDY